MSIPCEIDLVWIKQDITDDKSTLVQVFLVSLDNKPEPMLAGFSDAIWRH